MVSVAKWSGGWDLLVDGEGLGGGGVTQVTNLDEADAQVRNYLRSLFGADFSSAVIDIHVPVEEFISARDTPRITTHAIRRTAHHVSGGMRDDEVDVTPGKVDVRPLGGFASSWPWMSVEVVAH